MVRQIFKEQKTRAIMRRIFGVVGVVALGIALSACATKRYPMVTSLSGPEMVLMSCEQLQLADLEAEQVRSQIIQTARLDWRSAAAFYTDFGIGNLMARSDADSALAARQSTIRTAQANQDCGSSEHSYRRVRRTY